LQHGGFLQEETLFYAVLAVLVFFVVLFVDLRVDVVVFLREGVAFLARVVFVVGGFVKVGVCVFVSVFNGGASVFVVGASTVSTLASTTGSSVAERISSAFNIFIRG
jgi:hypothetical protein